MELSEYGMDVCILLLLDRSGQVKRALLRCNRIHVETEEVQRSQGQAARHTPEKGGDIVEGKNESEGRVSAAVSANPTPANSPRGSLSHINIDAPPSNPNQQPIQ